MHGSGGGKIEGIGPVDEVFYTMRFCQSIDDGGHRHRMTTLGPHSWLLSMQQSANILVPHKSQKLIYKIYIFAQLSKLELVQIICSVKRFNGSAIFT